MNWCTCINLLAVDDRAARPWRAHIREPWKGVILSGVSKIGVSTACLMLLVYHVIVQYSIIVNCNIIVHYITRSSLLICLSKLHTTLPGIETTLRVCLVRCLVDYRIPSWTLSLKPHYFVSEFRSCVSQYECIYIYIYIHIHTFMYIYIYTHTYTHTYTYTYIYIYICIYTHVYTYIYICIYICILCICIYTYTCHWGPAAPSRRPDPPIYGTLRTRSELGCWENGAVTNVQIVCIYIYICKHLYVYVYVCVCVYIYIYI